MSTQTERKPDKIWAVSMAKGASQVPKHVNRTLVGTDAWKIQQMKEVPDPHAEPDVRSITPITKADVTDNSHADLVAELQAQLQAERDRVAALEAAANQPAKEKRKYTKKDKTQA